MTAQRDLLNVDWSKIPAPVDDGAAAHLKGAAMPSITLKAIRSEKIASKE